MAGKKETERIKAWFMKNVILPNNEEIDKPGYVISKYAGKGTNCYVREVFFPEVLLAELEKNVIGRFGRDGERAIYAAGKMWGVRYGATTNLPKKSAMKKEEFVSFMDSFMKFLEAEYSTSVEYDLDYENDSIETRYENLMACRLNGHGLFLIGTLAGAWQHISGKEMAGTQPCCQGRGDKNCIIRCGPAGAPGSPAVHGIKAADLRLEREYFALNKVRKAEYAKNSFLDLLQSGMFKYEGGFFQANGERFLLNEASSVYFLEMGLGQLKGCSDIIFKTSFDYFRNFRVGKASRHLIPDLLPALGWGDIMVDVKKGRAFCRSYPWTGYYARTSFPIIRGMLSGLVSAAGGKRIEFRNAEPSISADSLDLVLDAD
jgi:predicted hydrocarbon binding protein